MTRHSPAHEVELYREEDAYVIYVDLAEYEPSEIDVRWHDSRLYVSADHSSGGRRSIFHRALGFPHSIDEDAVSATFEDGVLEVTLPIANGLEKAGREIQIA